MPENALQVLMPMGGLGSRFAQGGFVTPKPLIPVDGVPMYQRALQSIPDEFMVTHIFVLRAEHVERFDLATRIAQSLPAARIAVIGSDTAGSVETALAARELLDPRAPIIVMDCDLFFRSPDYFAQFRLGERIPAGVLPVFSSRDARYSYAEMDPEGRVLRTAEKELISDHAILGAYGFASGGLFLNLAEGFVADPQRAGLKEYYTSHLYNMLLEGGALVRACAVEEHASFGTPEELSAYERTQTARSHG